MESCFEMDRQIANKIVDSICNTDRITGFTHDFYKYPARFPPSFARQIIKSFSKENDLIFDPFMGGGTSLIEANAIGRRAIGSDISSLATFVTKVKTTRYLVSDITVIREWLNEVQLKVNLHSKIDRPWNWISEGYQDNLNGKDAWPIRKYIELIISEVNTLPKQEHQDFVRCLLLRTAQWAVDGKYKIPSIEMFRKQLFINFSKFSQGAIEFSNSIDKYKQFHKGKRRIQIYNTSSENLSSFIKEPPKLILTSPPYPGVHVLYHRWQVHGRKETSAPFWIANCKDGHGEAYYTMGGRTNSGVVQYFESIKQTFSSFKDVCDRTTLIVQVVAFSDIKSQLEQYLAVMTEVGFQEEKISPALRSNDGRLWREVPNRKWYTVKGTPSSQEVVLFHKLKI